MPHMSLLYFPPSQRHCIAASPSPSLLPPSLPSPLLPSSSFSSPSFTLSPSLSLFPFPPNQPNHLKPVTFSPFFLPSPSLPHSSSLRPHPVISATSLLLSLFLSFSSLLQTLSLSLFPLLNQASSISPPLHFSLLISRVAWLDDFSLPFPLLSSSSPSLSFSFSLFLFSLLCSLVSMFQPAKPPSQPPPLLFSSHLPSSLPTISI